MERLGKLAIMLLFAVIITAGVFVAGMVFQARFYGPTTESISVASLPNSDGETGLSLPVGSTPAEFETFWEAWTFLNDNFYGDIPSDDTRTYGAIRGMVNAFDDQHTAFVDPVRAAVSSENISGSFEGIGASIRMDEAGRLVIAHPFPDRPCLCRRIAPG